MPWLAPLVPVAVPGSGGGGGGGCAGGGAAALALAGLSVVSGGMPGERMSLVVRPPVPRPPPPPVKPKRKEIEDAGAAFDYNFDSVREGGRGEVGANTGL